MKIFEKIKKLQTTLGAIAAIIGMLYTGFIWVEAKFDGIASKGDIAAIKAEIDSLTGENKVFQFRKGYTYVVEPVHIKDDSITIAGQARRTILGASCIWKSAVALFEDGRGAPMPGRMLSTGRQLTSTFEPIKSEFELPKGLRPGRITVKLQMTYTCNSLTVVENTTILPFILQE